MPFTTSKQSRGRVLGTYAKTLLEQAEKAGVSSANLAIAAGLEPAAIDPFPEYVSVSDYCKLMDAGAVVTGNPMFGLQVGMNVFAGAQGLYGMILLSCKTLGEAMAQVMRYESILHDLGQTTMQIVDGDVLISWTGSRPEVDECYQLGESIVASFVAVGEALTRRPFPVIAVGLKRPTPGNEAPYQQAFQGKVKFGQDRYFGRASAEILAWPLPFAAGAVLPLLISHAEQLLRERKSSGAVGMLEKQVKDAIIQQLGIGHSAITDVARSLQVSVRTLQRKLQAVDLHYRVLLDETRRELSQHYLRSSRMTLTEIAFLVGYQEQSSFNHAFRAWTNLTPSQWREKHRDGGGL